VDDWSEEQLEAWARVNITKDTIPQLDWHQRQVAIWARKVLGFDADDEEILKKAKLIGADLLLYEDREDLKRSIGLRADGPARRLWAEIEKLKKSLAEPENKPTTHPALSIESQLQNLTLDALSES
jgi:hypothetical protein